MISAARRRPIRDIEQFGGWDGAYNDALNNDTVRPIHLAYYSSGSTSGTLNMAEGGERLILESCSTVETGVDYVNLLGFEGNVPRYIDLVGIRVNEIAMGDGYTLDEVTIRGTARRFVPSVYTIRLEGVYADADAGVGTLNVAGVNGNTIWMNGAGADPGGGGTGGGSANGGDGLPGSGEDGYTAPTTGGTGERGGIGDSGGDGGDGINGYGSSGVVMLTNCSFVAVRIHPSYGGNGGAGGNGGSANGGNGGAGGSAFSPGVFPGNGGAGGDGGTGGTGGNGGDGGEGSINSSVGSTFVGCSIGTLYVSALGGQAGAGGAGGAANAGGGGLAGYNGNYYGPGDGLFGDGGAGGNTGTPGGGGGSGMAGGNGGTSSYTATDTTIGTIL